MQQFQIPNCCVLRKTTTIDDVGSHSPLFLTTNAVHILRRYIFDVDLQRRSCVSRDLGIELDGKKYIPFRDQHQLRSKVPQPRHEQIPWPNEAACYLVTSGYPMLRSMVKVDLPTRSPVFRRGFVVTPSGGCKRSEINPVDPVVAAR